MKVLLATLAILAANPTHASRASSFRCELTKYPGQVITFGIKNLGARNAEFALLDSRDEYSGVFASTSDDEQIITLVDTLNGQGGDMRVLSDRIRFFGDNAGINFAYFELFKDSGYTRGFARMEFNFGEDKDYSPVTCRVR